MKQTTRSLLVLLTGLVLGTLLSLGGSVLADRSSTLPGNHLPLEELRNFSEIFGKIKDDYVEAADDKKMLENAIRGMLSGLDPHSSYLDQDEFKELQVGTSGEFGGLGIEVNMEDGFVKVVSPIDDTPAQAAGIKAGDLIIRLDDTPVKGMTLNEAVKMMRGKPGSSILLTIIREGEQKPLKLSITRDIIRVKSVKYQILDEGYGYLRITNFQNQTGEQVIRAVSDMKQEQGELQGLVLDLRNNPGGVLGAAVTVSDAFLDQGMIVYTEGRAKDAALRYNARPGDILKGAPIVVLVNGGSASASEIVAGALQDHKRAIIMGSRTFGKGSVQTIFPMSNNSAIKLTTARYYTPGGRSIQADGIEPDITLKAVKLVETEDNEDDRLKEANLTGHLVNGKKEQDKAGKKGKQDDDKARSETIIVDKDYALHEALNLLKGLAILQARQ